MKILRKIIIPIMKRVMSVRMALFKKNLFKRKMKAMNDVMK